MREKKQYFLVPKDQLTTCEDKAAVAAALAKTPDLVLLAGAIVPYRVESEPRLVFGEVKTPRAKKVPAGTVSPADVEKVSSAIATVPKRAVEIATETKLPISVVAAVLATVPVTKSGAGKGLKYLRGAVPVPPPAA